MSSSNQTQRISPDLPWTVRLLLAAHVLITDACRRSNITINRRLLNLFDPKVSPSSKPHNGVSSFDINIDPLRHLWFRLFIPMVTSDVSSIPIIIYYHGGGFASNSPNSIAINSLARRFSRRLKAIVVSVNYRLAPEHRYPTQYDDGFGALRFLDNVDNTNHFLPSNADLSQCFIAGDSAGGNLGHHVAVRASEYDFKRVKIVGFMAIQPFFGGEERTESEIRFSEGPVLSLKRTDWFWKAFLPEGSDRDHPASNVFGPKADLDISGLKFPATLMVVGGFDPLQDRQRSYYEELKRSGKEVKMVEYPNAIHAFYAFPMLTESSLVINDMNDFMEKQLAQRG
ncbi:Alpha/beta hydrolase-3 [Quillaja saponaria]|uniref:Alpha/beta hydrolase-3 n=1 Tax=Quillaja saponaria TaxID=32244 RepID=A0AAD7L387_QUISA|nr:Alpha/beta hydrolase-3 [Quillaja saponaria]